MSALPSLMSDHRRAGAPLRRAQGGAHFEERRDAPESGRSTRNVSNWLACASVPVMGTYDGVRVVTERRIREFIERDPRSAEAMWRWVDAIQSGSWRNPGELRGTFASVSFVGDLAVFNVGGNKYRIAAFVHYAKQIVYVKSVGTHKEYDKWDL